VDNLLNVFFSLSFGGDRWVTTVRLAYAALLVTGIVLSLTIQRRSRAIRIATGILSLPLWVFISAWIYIIFVVFKEPPTLRQLKADFPSRRADLETILMMAGEDNEFPRIASDFLYRTGDAPGEIHQYAADDPGAKLPKSRWDAYRKVYARNNIKLGFQRDRAGDNFIMVDSVGFLNNGHTTGYLHCVHQDSNTEFYRFGACMHQDGRAGHSVGKYSGDEKYAFEKLGDGWFVYDDGPAAE
jgi:hypothetical protein